MADLVAWVLVLAIAAYACGGGTDYGAGFWDLLAGGAERGKRPRWLIDHAMAPVWEANNVWLIFVLVLMWTGFPTVFEAVFTALWLPLALAAVGLVLRGAGFALRKPTRRLAQRRVYGAVFAVCLAAHAVLPRGGARRRRLRPGPGRHDRLRGRLGQPDLRPLRVCWPSPPPPSSARSSSAPTPAGSARPTSSTTSAYGRCCAFGAVVVLGAHRPARHPRRRPLRLRRPHRGAGPAADHPGRGLRSGHGAASAAPVPRLVPLHLGGERRPGRRRLGLRAAALPAAHLADGGRGGRAPRTPCAGW